MRSSSNKTTAHDIDEADRKKTGQPQEWCTRSSFLTPIRCPKVAHFPNGCVCLWIRGLFQFQHFGAAQGGSPFPRFKPEIPHCCPSSRDCQFHCQHSISLFHSCNGSVTSQRVRSKAEGEKRHASNKQSRHALIDDRCVRKKTYWKNMCSSSKAPYSHRFREVSFVDVNLFFH